VQVGFITGSTTAALLNLPDRVELRRLIAGSAIAAAAANALLVPINLQALARRDREHRGRAHWSSTDPQRPMPGSKSKIGQLAQARLGFATGLSCEGRRSGITVSGRGEFRACGAPCAGRGTSEVVPGS
jgi:hypothetical protein